MLLSIAAQRMSTQQVLVKDLQGVETLGAITMLATDKTGTLTRNQMTVTNMWTNGAMYSTEPAGTMKEGELPVSLNVSGIEEMVLISCVCSR
jgi:sodium/potassium-transporting ATPase subunit alpha